jgi:hypothetical protein
MGMRTEYRFQLSARNNWHHSFLNDVDEIILAHASAQAGIDYHNLFPRSADDIIGLPGAKAKNMKFR